MQHTEIRLGLPSKGRLESGSLNFLSSCGLQVHKPNPRQYQATIPVVPGLRVIFQRPGDIVVGVRNGSLDFGITGMDIVLEQMGTSDAIVILHDELGFGRCTLQIAVPDEWTEVQSLSDLANYAKTIPDGLRVATKYPSLTREFLIENGLPNCDLISAEGTLEVAPTIGYADVIADLVSSGQTLRDNRLRTLENGNILLSQASLIGNSDSLRTRSSVLKVARHVLELSEAYLRAEKYCTVVANMREKSPEVVAHKMFSDINLGGLQGPTISRVITPGDEDDMCSVEVVVLKDKLVEVIHDLRSIGGSGVVVTPVSYVFEEEPERYAALLEKLGLKDND
ncbi:MAG TPA: ATP phosphoribosyltransferase [Chloroflexi bacterium]|nr:ATP phosphoribosyltransferase [Chloroflexota bacterium]